VFVYDAFMWWGWYCDVMIRMKHILYSQASVAGTFMLGVSKLVW